MYSFIKSNNLGEAFKSKYGKNYTNGSNDMLTSFVNKHISKPKITEVKVAKVEVKEEPKKGEEVKVASNTNSLNRLIEVLNKKHILLKSELDYILN